MTAVPIAYYAGFTNDAEGSLAGALSTVLADILIPSTALFFGGELLEFSGEEITFTS